LAWYARTYRALLLRERQVLYVESAIAAGAGRWRVLLRHVLPNIIGPAAVLATANFGSVILNLAGGATVLSVNLLGDALRDVADPRTR
jgi:ABC-type dipeptide/oligopeptide/nickel transport system permease subunit